MSLKVKWKFSEEDRKVVVQQLGREPRGVLGVATRCPYGFPQVIANRPVTVEIEDLTVFPTLFWLTCPYLKKVVAQLESEGWISKFMEELETDETFSQEMTAAHDFHAKLRRELVPDKVLENLSERYPKRHRVLTESGVGGIRNYQGVKCLHTHLADYLVTKENPVGRKVLTLLGNDTTCSSGECAKEL